jgi:hypothetical protein
MQTGVAPYWNSSIFSGVPFLADIQKGAFYPPGIIFAFLNFSGAFKIFIAAHFIIMGLALYFFLRELGFRRTPSVIACLVFLFNTFTATRLDFLSALSSYAWMPVILLCFYKFLKTGRFVYWPLLALFTAISALAGHPPTLFYTAILLLCFWIYFMASRREKFRARDALNILFFAAITALTVFMLSMPQSGMFSELLNASTRGRSFEYNMASESSMAFKNLWSFLMPAGINGFHTNYLGEWIMYSMGIMNFFSVTAVFLLTLSFFYPKNKLYIFSVLTACLAVLLSLGGNTPVHSWFFTFFPFFSMLRHPGFAMTLFMIPACIMIAFTVQNIISMTHAHVPIINRFRYTSGISRRVFMTLFYIILAFAAVITMLVSCREAVMKNYSLSSGTFFNFIFGLLAFLAIFSLNFVMLYLKEKGKISLHFYAGLLVFFVLFELMYAASGVNPAVSEKIYNPDSLNLETVPILRSFDYKFLHTPAAAGSGFTKGSDALSAEVNFLRSIPSNTGLVYGLNDAGGYNPVQPEDYTNFLKSVVRDDRVLNPEKLSIMNVKYLICLSDPGVAGLEKVYDSDFKIYRNPGALPIFFTSKDISSPELIVGQYSWSRKKDLDYSMFKIDAGVEDDGYFIFSNNYYPGWNVYVDNKISTIEKCFGLYMGVKLTKGRHEVIFKYVPTNLYIYMLLFGVISAAMLFFGTGYLILVIRKNNG